jgi:hypothetical protein
MKKGGQAMLSCGFLDTSLSRTRLSSSATFRYVVHRWTSSSSDSATVFSTPTSYHTCRGAVYGAGCARRRPRNAAHG